MKKKWLWLIGLTALVVCGILLHRQRYPLSPVGTHLENAILEQYNQGRYQPLTPEIRIYSAVHPDYQKPFSRQYWLIEIDEMLGYAELERGLTDRYRLVHLSYGNSPFWNRIVESGGKKHLLFGGRDLAEQIATVTAELHGTIYEMPNPNPGTHFLLDIAVPAQTEESHLLPEAFRYYDAAGADITHLY